MGVGGGGVLLGWKCWLISRRKVRNTMERKEIGSPACNEGTIEVMGLIRTPDGFLTGLTDAVPV